MTTETALPIALLQPLVSRVRTDVHWKKKTGSPPFMVKAPLTDLILAQHLDGGTAKGACPIKAGESTTRVAVLDLDSHKGETSWEEMGLVAHQLTVVLKYSGGVKAIPFSSSGGKGIHLYMVWDEPQDCYSVRDLLRGALKSFGYTDGAGGVSNNQIEIFPKQDSVPLDGFGNMFILPYSGESVPLEPMAEYQRMPKDYPVEWPVSAPVPVVQKPERVVSSLPTGQYGRLSDALASISCDLPYDKWLRVGQAIHHETSGDQMGLVTWDTWSASGTDYPGFEELESKWESFGRSSAQPVTAGTIYKMATDYGWKDVSDGSEFDVLPAEEVAVSNPLRFATQNALAFASSATHKYIIKGVLPEADLAIIVGDSGSGKSFFTLDMVCAIARGIPWRGRRVTKGRVVYVIAEGSSGFRNRIQAYASHHGLSELDLDVISAAPNFMEKRDIKDLIASIAVGGPCSLVVVDTVAQVTAGGNENSGEDMGLMLANCRALRAATGAMVLLVHHTGKDASKGARGWSGFRGNTDCLITIEREDDARTATITKLKDGDDGLRFGFKLSTVPVGFDEDGDPVTSCVVDEAEVSEVSKSTNRKRKTGDNERVLTETVRDYFEANDEWLDVNTLINMALEALPESNMRVSARKGNLNRSLKTLLDDGILFESGGFISNEEQDLVPVDD